MGLDFVLQIPNTKIEEKQDREPEIQEEIGPVDRLTARELSPVIQEALDRNQKLPLSSRCTHPLAVLRINPEDESPIWSRQDFVSKTDEPKVNIIVEKWIQAKVIEPAPEDCANCFPILTVPKKDA